MQKICRIHLSIFQLKKHLLKLIVLFWHQYQIEEKKNEPSFIKHTAIKLSEIKEINFEKLVFETTKNFNRLFNFS